MLNGYRSSTTRFRALLRRGTFFIAALAALFVLIGLGAPPAAAATYAPTGPT